MNASPATPLEGAVATVPTLDIQGLTVAYDRLRVVRNVSLQVEQGQVVALLGANGAGKTTTLRAISGSVRPESGHVTFDGRSIEKAHPHTIARMGVVHIPEGRGIFPALTVRENIEMIRRAAGVGPEAYDQVGDFFPILIERLSSPARTLSGGQQQMLSLTRALLGAPQLIMLDEISLGLAPKIVDSLYEVVQRIAATGVPILLVEQYITIALRIANYIYVLEHGEIVDQGPPAEIRERGLVARYLGSLPAAAASKSNGTSELQAT